MEQILDQVDRAQDDYIYGGFWERFIALIIDSLFLGLVQLALSSAVEEVSYSYGYTGSGFILSFLYTTYFTSSSKQATLGKQAMGLKVITTKGERLTFWNAAGRFFASYLSLFILCIGYIMAAFDSKKQALHDRLANTYVIRVS